MKYKIPKSFIKKVQSMTAKEIIETMIEGLKNPVTKIDMESYGYKKNNICYGCAATNTIARILKLDSINNVFPDQDSTPNLPGGFHSIINDYEVLMFVQDFEQAINHLRLGNVNAYNIYATHAKFAKIKYDSFLSLLKLPILDSENYLDEFSSYQKLADLQ